MNAFAPFPATLHWNAQQLADAVPLRLSEMFRSDNAHDGDAPAANREPRAERRTIRYLSQPALLARFVIR